MDRKKGRSSGGHTSLDDSIGQLESVLEGLDAKRDLALGRRVDHRRRSAHENAHLARSQRERADRHAAAAEDEVVGAEAREIGRASCRERVCSTV